MNYYISDLHFGHSNVIRFDKRPFANVDEMDLKMIELWNMKVSPTDNVYIIGDICCRNSKPPHWYLAQLTGHKHLVLGNHDIVVLKDKHCEQFLESINQMELISDDGKNIFLCHYPICDWYKARHGSWLIYGHIHNKRGDAYEFMKTKDHALNASACINGYVPVNFDELVHNNLEFKNTI